MPIRCVGCPAQTINTIFPGGLVVTKSTTLSAMSQLQNLLQYLEDRNWSYLACFIIWIAKLFSSEETRLKDEKFIDNLETNISEINGLLQREIRLLEDIDELTTLAILEPDGHDQDRIRAERDLSEVRQHLWLYKKFRFLTPTDVSLGPWVCEWFTDRIYRPDQVWDSGSRVCQLTGGCCERQCGCCRKPRQTDKGKTTTWADLVSRSTELATHCEATECGCCIRSRGFDLNDINPLSLPERLRRIL
jgi:hypothetical protein